MDLFGKKRIAELESQLRLANAKVLSLESDLEFLERERDQLKSKYEPSSGLCIVRTSPGSLWSPASQRAPERFREVCAGSSSQSESGGGALVAALALSALSSGVSNGGGDCQSSGATSGGDGPCEGSGDAEVL